MLHDVSKIKAPPSFLLSYLVSQLLPQWHKTVASAMDVTLEFKKGRLGEERRRGCKCLLV